MSYKVQQARTFLLRLAAKKIFKGCMLAKIYDPSSKRIKYPVIVEKKLNGLRLLLCISNKHGNHAWTRKGIDYIDRLSYLIKQAKKAGIKEAVIDGEFTGKSWGASQSTLKTHKMDEKKRKAGANYFVFDTMPVKDYIAGGCKRPLAARRKGLSKLRGQGNFKIVPAVIARTPKEVKTAYKKYLGQKHEGIMIKDPKAPYVLKRSSAWLKWKPIATHDGKVVDYKEGKNAFKGMLGALKVKILSGLTKGAAVYVGGGWTIVQRKKLWKKRRSLIGKVLEYKAQKETGKIHTSKSSLNAIFLRWRDDEL